MPKPQRSSVHGSDGDGPGPVLSRSVAFEVSRPDLGHVNVRVAIRNDLVHAHLSSDRLDVAQYLAAELGCEIAVIGIQANHLTFDGAPSAAAQQAAQDVAAELWAAVTGRQP